MPTTKTAHTPGPWTFYAETHGCDIYERKSFGRGEFVARIPGETAHFEGNARLIAAAPELLEAANLLAKAGEHFKAGARDGATMGEISLAIDAALAAIKKATGEVQS